MRVSAVEKGLNYLILAIFALFAAGPLVTVLATAVGPGSGASPGIHLENLVQAWETGRFASSISTSALVALIVVTVALVASLLAGYAFATMRFPGSTLLFYLFLLGLMVPSEAIVIPLFFDLRQLGLTDTLAGVTLPQIAQSTAFGTFWMRSQFKALPPNLIEAAALDGASGTRTLARVLAPATWPSIVTLTLLMFMWTWNEFLIPLVMSPTGRVSTAPLGLAIFKGQYTADTAALSSAGLIIAAPIVGLYFCLQRFFISGLLEGAAKE